MIYAKKHNCPKNTWLLSNKSGEAKASEAPLDIYKPDKEAAKEKIKEIIEEMYSMKVIEFNGEDSLIVENTMDVLNNKDGVLLKKCAIKNKNNDYYIKYDYLFKQKNTIIIYFILFKSLEKALKDYETKKSLIPKILYSVDILESNFPKCEIVTKAIYLDGSDFKTGDIDKNNFNQSDLDKCSNLYDKTKDDEPPCSFSRKCKKCDFRDYCGIPKVSLVDLETTPNCWRKIDPIILANKTLDMGSLTEEQLNTLTPTQLARYEAYMSPNGIYMNKNIIDGFLNSINKVGYASLDFETYSSMIPFNEKYSNYSQIPYSYSLDIVNNNDIVVKHDDYIVDYKENNFDSLIKQLVLNLPTNIPIVVYFKTFEISRFREMQELYPEHNDIIQCWIDNVVDLYEVFEKGGYYDVKFNNSISLKNVYPVMCESNNYENLDINHGDTASLQYKEIFNAKNIINSDVIQNNLMDYNRQDTVSPIEIIKELKKIVE